MEPMIFVFPLGGVKITTGCHFISSNTFYLYLKLLSSLTNTTWFVSWFGSKFSVTFVTSKHVKWFPSVIYAPFMISVCVPASTT